MPTLYFSFLLFVPALWLFAAGLHGLVKTEALTIGGWANFFKDIALGSLMLMAFVWLIGVTSPLLIAWNLVDGVLVSTMFASIWPWLVWILIANIVTGFINHIIVGAYSKKRWGTTSPRYNEWDEFDDNARRGGSRTTIWFNGQGASPVRRTSTASLSSRASTRVAQSSRYSSASKQSTRMSLLPALSFRSSSSSRRSSRSSSSGGKKGGSSGGDGLGKAAAGCLTLLASALKAIAAFLIQLLVITVLLAVTAFYAWLGYWLTSSVTDWFDEIYVIEGYA